MLKFPKGCAHLRVLARLRPAIRRLTMTDATVVEPTRTVYDFRVGSVMGAAASILARNALFFLPITAVTALPIVFMLSDILSSGGEIVFVDILWGTGLVLFISSFTGAALIFAT